MFVDFDDPVNLTNFFCCLLCLPICLVGKKRGGEPWGNFCVTSSFFLGLCVYL